MNGRRESLQVVRLNERLEGRRQQCNWKWRIGGVEIERGVPLSPETRVRLATKDEERSLDDFKVDPN